MHCIFRGIPLYHTLTNILDADALTYVACRSFNVQKLEDFSHFPSIFPVVFPYDQSFYLITSVTEVTPFPSTIPAITIVIYVVVCSCPWSSTQVTLSLDHPHFHFRPPTYLQNQTHLIGCLLTLVWVLVFPGGSALYFFHAQYTLTMS